MVHLYLSSTKGNQGLRYFPYIGYLGLTPIRVEGVVRTKLDDDQRPILATSLTISIRCYESRLGRVNFLRSNLLVDHTQVLWSKPDGVEYEAVGNLDYPFRLTLPKKVGGFSTTMFVDYRCTWRLEAVLNHVHIPGVGSRQVKHFELPFIRYDLPEQLPFPLVPDPFLSQQTVKPRAPRIRYNIDTPMNAIGPTDLVPVTLHIQPVDPTVSIRSTSVIIERRIQLLDNSNVAPTPSFSTNSDTPKTSPLCPRASPASSSASISSPRDASPIPDSPKASTSSSSVLSSNPTLTPNTALLSSSSVTSNTRTLIASNPEAPSPQGFPHHLKLISDTITEAESSGHILRDVNGVWNNTLTLQWPVAKSHSRWGIGETIRSDMVTVRYFVRAKIVVTSPSGSDTLELGEKELFVVSTNSAERQLAITKYNELLDSAVLHDHPGRSKSKSPGRTTRQHDTHEALPPSPLPSISPSISKPDVAHMSSSSLHNNNGSSSSRSKSRYSLRRPHTSAGPRDKFTSSPSSATAAAAATTTVGGPRLDSSPFSSTTRARDVYTTAEVSSPPRGDEPVHKQRRISRHEDEPCHHAGRVVVPLTRPGSSHADAKRSGKNYLFSSSAPKMGSVPSGSSTSTSASTSSMSSGSYGGLSGGSGGGGGGGTGTGTASESDDMREWEEELARIEMKSRRSSDLLGFAKFLRKRLPASRVVVPGS